MSFTVKNYNSATNMSNLYDEIITNSINGFDITNMEEWSKLTADEIKQLQNIDENKISNTAWSRVSNMQDVGPSSSPTFYNNHFNEGTGSTNLYFTDARARATISAGTGIIYDLTTGTISNIIETTSDLPEGTNLYFTTARASSGARNAISAGTGIAYDTSTGIISNTIRSTTNLPEGTNSYFTDTRASSGARNAITGSAPILYNSATGVIGLNYVSTNLTMTGTSLNTVQNISTTSAPTFTGMSLSGLPADYFVRTTTGGKLFTSPVYMRDIQWFVGPSISVGMYDYALNTVQNITTSSSPTFKNLTLQGPTTDLRMIMHNESGPTGARSMAFTNNAGYGGLIVQALSNSNALDRNVAMISHTGYVGIGTLNPASQLHIASDSKTDSIINLERAGGKRAMLASALNGVGLGFDASAYFTLGSITGPGFTGWSEKARLTAGGNLGIGNTNPTEKLHVGGNIKCDGFADIRNGIYSRSDPNDRYNAVHSHNANTNTGASVCVLLSNNNNACEWYLNSSVRTADGGGGCATISNKAGDLRLWSRGATGSMNGIFIQKDTGNIGIGSTGPSERLHVNGNIRCDNLTASQYVKTNASKNLVSASNIPFSDITNPPVVSSGSFSPVLSTINWASGTGAIDNSMHHYLRAANFCELSGRTLITPTDSKCSWLGYNMTVPVNHTGFVSSYIFSGNGFSKTTLIPAFEAYSSYPTDYTTLRMYFNFPPAGDTSYTVNYRITYSI